MLRLSIIVPVYNVENYLERCIESLKNQDIIESNYEIILIDDGSVDKSNEIAKSYIHQSTNIKLISQENKGLGAARNAGINSSKGKYLLFVDSDDFIKPNCLSELIGIMENSELDILRFNYNIINEEGNIIQKRRNSLHAVKYNNKIVDGKTFLTDNLGWASYAWSFILNTSLIKDNFLFFKEGIYYEDVDWLIRTLTVAKKVRSINNSIYYYIQRKGSITQCTGYNEKNKTITDRLQNLSIIEHLMSTTDNQKIKSWCEGMITLNFIDILSYVENELPERKQELFNYLRDFSSHLKSYRFTFKQWFYLQIIKINPQFYCYLTKRK